MIKVGSITPDVLPLVRERVADLLAPAVAYSGGRMRVGDVLDQVAGEQVSLWVALDDRDIMGAVVGRPVQYYRRKALNIMLIAGNARPTWHRPMAEKIEQSARHIGCDLIEGLGRPGWRRILPDCRISGFVYEKDL